MALNGTVVVAVVALVAVLALVVRPPSPPGIAAFAPQAAKQITKAPQQQTSTNGDQPGECASGQTNCEGVSPSPSPSPSPSASKPPLLSTGVPSNLQCYTWPDGAVTQTFDPQSPPCIAGWDDKAGNGGATTPGVTGTEIRVALPTGKSLSNWPGDQPLVNFVNARFQLYGRKITIVPVQSTQAEASKLGTDLNNPSKQRADAAQIAQSKVFASFDFIDPVPYNYSLPDFRNVLTQHKIISIAGGAVPPYGTAAGLASKAPYEWTYLPTMDEVMANVGTVTCRELVGKPASHTLDEKLQTQTRKFALMIPSDEDQGGPPPGLSSLLGILHGCGVDPKVVRFATDDSAATTKASMTQLQKDGVTSLIFLPTVGSANNTSPLAAAGAIGYYPEWITIGRDRYLTDVQTSTKSTKQLRAMFGVGGWNKMAPLANEVWAQAFQAGGGDFQGVQNSNDGRALYEELLLLASGIQEAGPNLTPESFAKGLHDTEFDNPGAGAAPIYQATVGFPNNSTTMVQDLTAFWIAPDAGHEIVNGADNKALNTYRAECYSYLGRRWSRDSWPSDDVFYKSGCR